jgi:hypothetical protein
MVQVGCLINNYRRIARACDYGAFSTVESCASHSGTARNTNQCDAAVFEKLLRGLERWLAYEGNQVVDSEVRMDRLIKAANTFRCNATSAWVWVYNDRVPASDHAHCISRDRWKRVGDWRDGADHTEWSMLDHGQAMIAAVAFGL